MIDTKLTNSLFSYLFYVFIYFLMSKHLIERSSNNKKYRIAISNISITLRPLYLTQFESHQF